MEPLVSVIIPVYNVLPYLREALDSVINQTYKNLEILVVDDGSTDGSGDVCDEYLSDHRVIVIHQENRGLSGARNTALDRMTGEYVAFLDSDDAFMPEMIEKMLEAMIRNRADAAMCGYVGCYTNLNLHMSGVQNKLCCLYNQETVFSPSDSLKMIINDQICWAVWDKLFRFSIWTSLRFPEGNNFEDMRIMCQVLERCKRMVAVSGVHVLYRQRPGSITKTHNEKNLRDYLLAASTVEQYVEQHMPSLFSQQNMLALRERHARILSNRYAHLIYKPHSSESLSRFRREILLRWKGLEGRSCRLKSRVLRSLFMYAPCLIVPFRFCWVAGKSLAGKVIHS